MTSLSRRSQAHVSVTFGLTAVPAGLSAQMQIVRILRRGTANAAHGAVLARFRPQYRAGERGKEDGRATPARSGRFIARGRSRVRRERDHDEVQAEAGSVARRSPTPRTRRAPHRRRLRAWPNGRAVLRILARLAATRAHNHRAVCEVREVVGAAGSNQPTPHFPLLVRYRPAEGTASGGIGCNVRHHDRDRAAARSKRFVSSCELSCGRSQLLRDGRRRRFSSSSSFASSSPSLSRSVTSSERARTRRGATSRAGRGRPRPRP